MMPCRNSIAPLLTPRLRPPIEPRRTSARFRAATQLLLAILLALGGLAAAPSAAQMRDADPFAPLEDPDRAMGQPGELGGGIRGVDVQVASFGLAGFARPGTWTPVRVNVSYAGNEARNVLVVLEQPDADGDIIEVAREMALNPGANPVLLYTLLPPATLRGDTFDVVVHELDARGERVEQLAARRVPVASIVEPDTGVVGVVGNRTANLLGYRSPVANASIPPTGHEFVHTLSGMSPFDLPDRWMGLDLLEALVWMDGDPADLRGERAEALAEWVARGGHLIVVLPEFEQDWLNPAALPAALRQILPAVRITRWEGQAIVDQFSAGGVLRHISRYSRIPDLPTGGVIPRVNLHLLEPLNGDWTGSGVAPMMEVEVPTPEGATRRLAVAAQRAVGMGQVTLVGIPVANQALNQPLVDLPHADVFWNRILGWRVDVISDREWDVARRQGTQQRATVKLDEAIPEFTQLAWRAQGGVLLALVVFLVYWAVSGPLAFAALKKRGKARWSWMAFVAAAAIFTAISWVGARSLRAGGIEVAHLSVLDHVAMGPGYQRAVSYINMDLRGYGRRTISIDARPEEPNQNDYPLTLDDGRLTLEPHNTIFSFQPFGRRDAGFPDVRRYQLNAAEPEVIEPYARSTAKLVVASWVGNPQPTWSMPTPESPDTAPTVVTNEYGQVVAIRGRLVHNLPSRLSDTYVLHVTNRRARFTPRLVGQAQGMQPLDIYAWGMPDGRWDPGRPLDLSMVCRPYDQSSRANAWVARLMRDVSGSFDSGLGFGERRILRPYDALVLLGFYQVIEPNNWMTPQTRQAHFARQMARDWDISEWLNRPCLIIVGYLHRAPPAVPLDVDGVDMSAVDQGSRTLVRWIYPLPAESEPYVDRLAPRPDPPALADLLAPRGPGEDTAYQGDETGERPPRDGGRRSGGR